jgi:hypothetical protein
MQGRALTPKDKKAVLDLIYKAWLMLPELRLGQLIDGALSTRPTTEPLPDFFYIEDEALANRVEEYATERTVGSILGPSAR